MSGVVYVLFVLATMMRFITRSSASFSAIQLFQPINKVQVTVKVAFLCFQLRLKGFTQTGLSIAEIVWRIGVLFAHCTHFEPHFYGLFASMQSHWAH